MSAVYFANIVGERTDFDLPAGQRSVCRSSRIQVCRNLAVLQGELALQSRHIKKDGQDKLGPVQNPLPILELDKRHRGREEGSNEWEEAGNKGKEEESRNPEKDKREGDENGGKYSL